MLRVRYLPGRPKRHAAVTVDGLDAEYLVQLDLTSLETEPRASQVELPHAGLVGADLGDRLVPVRIKIGAPVRQRFRVVVTQVLLMLDLEPVVLHRGDDRAEPLQLAVREHVAIDE